MSDERRQFPRLPLHLPVAYSWDAAEGEVEVRTSNVSAGGIFFRADAGAAPAHGHYMVFELAVPPGQGYSAKGGKIRGLGRVIRSQPLDDRNVGVAVRFTQPLAIEV
jgi:hypothetical protein